VGSTHIYHPYLHTLFPTSWYKASILNITYHVLPWQRIYVSLINPFPETYLLRYHMRKQGCAASWA
jgi:hypothetical protein